MDPLSKVLYELNVEGRLYFQKSLALPWSVNVHRAENVVRFHIVKSGHCYVRLNAGSESILVEQGDILLITQGESHTIYSDLSSETESIELNQILYSDFEMIDDTLLSKYNSTKVITQLVCGHYTFDRSSSASLLSTLPIVIHKKNSNDEFSHWMSNTLELCALSASNSFPHSDIVVVKAAEIALALAIRMHLHSKGFKPIAINDLLK